MVFALLPELSCLDNRGLPDKLVNTMAAITSSISGSGSSFGEFTLENKTDKVGYFHLFYGSHSSFGEFTLGKKTQTK